MSKITKGNKNLFQKNLKLEKKGISFDDYGIKPLVEIDVNDTMYNTFKKTATKRLDKPCIEHNGVIYTYSEILKMVDDFASSLDLSGVKKGDKIALPIDHSIQSAVALIAINKIGAISKWIDVEKSAMELLDSFKETDIKFVIASKFLEGKINNIKKDLKINDDSILLFDTSLSGVDSEFSKFLKKGGHHKVEAVEYEKDMPAIMITSSGSTGKPKNMLHSSYSVNSAVKKLTYTDYPIKDNIMLIAIPPYIGLGLITTLYSSMICGGEAIILPEYKDPFAFVKYIKSNINKLNNLSNNKKILLFAAPVFFKSMVSSLNEIDDLSFIGAMVAAGNKIERETLLEMDKKFKEKGCNVPVCNAYGQNEHCGGITYNTITFNKEGSAGKVAYGTRIMIVDLKTGEEVPINEIGKIVEQSDSQFLGYENNPEAEENSVFVDKDGEKWFDTKDLGSFDEDKFLHIFDRESRSIIRFDFKVALATVENKLLKHDNIKEAIAVKVKVESPFGKDQAPYVFVVLKDEMQETSYESIISDIQSGEYPLSMLETPINIEFIKEEQIPYKNNKINYIKLEEVAQSLVDSQFDIGTDNKEKVKSLN